MPLTSDRDRQFAALMARAQGGDKRAYEALLKDICDLLKGYVERRLGRGQDSEDVLQNILISIHNARHTYDSNRPFGPWMYAIARYRVCDHWRKAAMTMNQTEYTEAQETVTAPIPSDQTLADRLAKYLERLPEKQRHVIDLLKMKGLSIRKAAEQLNMSEAAIKVTAHRAYKTLRRDFEGDTDEYA